MGLSIRVVKTEAEIPFLGAAGRRTRVLLDPDTGCRDLSLFYVEFPPGTETEEHEREVAEIVYVLSGETAILVPGEEERRAGPGSVIHIPPGVRHRHRNPGTVTLKQLGIFVPPGDHAREVRRRPRAK